MASQEFPLLTQEVPGVLHFGGARMALLEIESGFWSICRQMEALIGPRLTKSVLQQAGANGGASFASSFFSEKVDERSTGFQTCLQAYEVAGFGRFEIETMDWPLGRVVIRARDTFEAWMTSRHGQTSAEPVCAYTAGVLVGFINVINNRQDVVCIERCCQAQGAEDCEFELLPADQTRGQEQVVTFNPDPGLSRQINLLEMLFERMPMGIAIFDRNYYFRRYNPTWEDFSRRYAPPSAAPLAQGTYYFDLLPGSESIVIPLLERVLTGETIRQTALRFESGGITSYWDVVLAPLFENGEVSRILNVTIDATERVQAEQRLKETLASLEESQRALTTLISNLPGMAYRCRNDRDWTMEFVSEGSLDLTGYRPEELVDGRKVNYGDLIHPEDRDTVWGEVQTALSESRPFKITYRINTPAGEKWVWEQGQGVSSSEGEIIALEGFITDITVRVTAQQNLEQRVDERTRELSTRQRELQMLLDVAAAANSSLNLDELLTTTLDRLVTLIGASRAGVMMRDENTGTLASRMLRPERAIPTVDMAEMIRSCETVVARGEPLFVTPDAELGLFEPGALLPLRVRGDVLGVLVIIGPQGDAFKPGQLALFKSIADQLSVAVENARLYAQAEQAAVATERSRLARDLHDAVTQTLFSASLIADVLPKLWERNPTVGQQKLEELRQLTRGALSEMRTLLLELRPDTLIEVELGDLYRHLAIAFTGRTRIPVTYSQEGQSTLPPEVKEAFYRVAQEALNNIAKHAGASQVQVRLTAQDDQAEISIRDDGCGFDVSALSAENLGLKIMRERAEAVHAELDIQSAPGAWTQIHLRWRAREDNT